jgi:hypothetical protein
VPFPEKTVGTAKALMPFDPIVVVMMENHFFDNLFAALPLTHAEAHGLSFDAGGNGTPAKPWAGHTPDSVTSYRPSRHAQATGIPQSSRATHEQIHGGAMDGLVESAQSSKPTGYFTPEVHRVRLLTREDLRPREPPVLLSFGADLSESLRAPRRAGWQRRARRRYLIERSKSWSS